MRIKHFQGVSVTRLKLLFVVAVSLGVVFCLVNERQVKAERLCSLEGQLERHFQILYVRGKFMDPIVQAALIGAGTNLASGFLFPSAGGYDHKAQKKAKAFAREQMAFNLNAQKEFAQHGLRWRVEDAKAAGLSPLAALGGASFQPSTPHVAFPQKSRSGSAERTLRGIGQDISRAVRAQMTPEEKRVSLANARIAEADAKLKELQVKRQIEGPGSPNFNPVGETKSTNVYEIEPKPAQNPAGIGTGTAPMHDIGLWNTIDQVRGLPIYSKYTSESMESDNYTGAKVLWQKIGGDLKQYAKWRGVVWRNASELYDNVRKLKNYRNKVFAGRTPKGAQWLYDAKNAQWVLTKFQGQNRIYLDPPKWRSVKKRRFSKKNYRIPSVRKRHGGNPWGTY